LRTFGAVSAGLTLRTHLTLRTGRTDRTNFT
jgi:hypothetical protein